MSDLSLSEIEQAITSHEYTYTWTSSWDGQTHTSTVEMDWHEWWSEGKSTDDVEIPGVGTVSVAETFGGEGQGDSAWVVLIVTEPDGKVRWFRKDGWYASYDGADFDGDFREVRPRQKTITVYE